VLEVDDLHVEFRLRDRVVYAVNGLSYSVNAGETLALLGESGCGKSVSAQAVLGVLDTPPAVVRGAIRFHGTDLTSLAGDERRRIRGRRIAMVFQDALSALNPVIPIGEQIAETFRYHLSTPRREAKARAVVLLERVGIPAAAKRAGDYPHQFSGGMRQRVMIAMALALEPELLIADEPTTALDVTVQAQIMRLLSELQDELGMTMILITHDLSVVAQVADRLVVMYAGRVAEQASALDLFDAPAHPYTEGLLASIPRIDRSEPVKAIPGAPPTLQRIPAGCPFHPRCSYATAVCVTEVPPLRTIRDQHLSACHHAEQVGTRAG
jgi:oligopeptide transport system ATP-binding protein